MRGPACLCSLSLAPCVPCVPCVPAGRRAARALARPLGGQGRGPRESRSDALIDYFVATHATAAVFKCAPFPALFQTVPALLYREQ